MRKYLAILAVIFALATYVAIQDQRTATKPTEQRTQPATTAVATETHDNQPNKDGENAEWNSPRWHRLFAWPEGITTWAIILTLLAVAEQARESARATQAVRDSIPVQKSAADAALLNAQALINSERPWIVIEIEKKVLDGIAVFRISATNHGRSPARMTACVSPVEMICMSPDTDLPMPFPSAIPNEWKAILPPGKRTYLTPFCPESPESRKQRALFSLLGGTDGKPISVVYGEIVYGDNISPEPYRTRYCFKHDLVQFSVGGDLIPCGPRGYNLYT